MNGAAKRGAVKFTACASIIIFGIVASAHSGSPVKIFLYVVALGLCVKLIWPTQDEGDALIKAVDDEKR